MKRGLLVAGLLGLGCASSPQPDRRPRPPDVAAQEVPVFGHYTRVRLGKGRVHRGELLAVEREGLWLRTGAQARVDAVGALRVRPAVRHGREDVVWLEFDAIRDVMVHRYRVRRGYIATSTWAGGYMVTVTAITVPLLGAVSLVFVIPSAVGVSAAVVGTVLQSRTHPSGPEALRDFARFPAGLPKDWRGLDGKTPPRGPWDDQPDAPLEP